MVLCRFSAGFFYYFYDVFLVFACGFSRLPPPLPPSHHVKTKPMLMLQIYEKLMLLLPGMFLEVWKVLFSLV